MSRVHRCAKCGIDMGVDNPEQLCGTTHCMSVTDDYWPDEIESMSDSEPPTVNPSTIKRRRLEVLEEPSDNIIATRSRTRSGISRIVSEEQLHDESENDDSPNRNNDSQSEESFVDFIAKGLKKCARDSARSAERQMLNLSYSPKINGVTRRVDKIKLRRLKNMDLKSTPRIADILRMQLPDNVAADIVQKIIALKNVQRSSFEYLRSRNELRDYIAQVRAISDTQILSRVNAEHSETYPTLSRIMNSSISPDRKLHSMRQVHQYHLDRLCGATVDYSGVCKLTNDLDPMSHFVIERIKKQLLVVQSKIPESAFARVSSEFNAIKDAPSDNASEILGIQRWLNYVEQLPTVNKQFPLQPDDPPEVYREFKCAVLSKLEQHIRGQRNIKEIVTEFIFAKVANPNSRRNILAFESAPGMGKSTLAEAIADCLGLQCVKIHLGGVDDVAIIRGHSKTYVNPVPGVVVQRLCTQQYKNCVIFLDEIDKVGVRHAEEIYGALCELLDPDHNHKFEDHYLGFQIDVSSCIFIIAMNNAEKCSNVLLNRMPIYKLNPYTSRERTLMAMSHLVPKLMTNYNLTSIDLIFTEEAATRIDKLSRHSELGVRTYIRNLETVLRKLNVMRLTRSGLYADIPAGTALTLTAEMATTLFWEPPNIISDGVARMYS